MRIALLGLGLIGGSIARAVHARRANGPDDTTIIAWSPSGAGPEAAVRDGVIDGVARAQREAISGADLIVLAGPATACLAQLDELAGAWRGALAPGAVVTDVASTKRAIVERAGELGLRFIGGHPMAGRETSGYGASSADLFVDRPWVIVPSDDDDADAVERVEALATATGARPLRMTAAAHDEAVAAISHLPLIAAAAIVEAVAGGSSDPAGRSAAAELAASGWRDITRLARGDVAMGAGIVSTNAPAIAPRVRELIRVLETWLTELERSGGPDEAAVAERLRTARDGLESMTP
jgi:prephenate dehydrogenase